MIVIIHIRSIIQLSYLYFSFLGCNFFKFLLFVFSISNFIEILAYRIEITNIIKNIIKYNK